MIGLGGWGIITNMKNLSQNWFIDGLIDTEYKQYVLLAYLQEVEKVFSKYMLFPVYDELQSHQRTLSDYKKKKELMKNNFPQVLKEIDLKNHNLIYKSQIIEDTFLKTVDEIVEWSMPQINKFVDEGNKIYSNIHENIEIEPVGLMPFNLSVGFLLLPDRKTKKIKVFNYSVTLYANSYGVKEVHTRYITSFNHTIINTPEKIKTELILHPKHKFMEIPVVPATFFVLTNYYYPVESSLLPVVKNKLLEKIEGK